MQHFPALVEHSLSFRRSMSGSALVILVDNIAGYRHCILVAFVDILFTSRDPQASSARTIDNACFPIYMLPSGHCCFEDVSQSLKISVLFMSAMRSCDSLLNSLILFVCLKSRRKDSLFGLFDFVFTMCILLLDCRKRYTKNSVIHGVAPRFPRHFLIRLVGHRLFLRPFLFDLVDQLASSICNTTRGILEVKRTTFLFASSC